MTAYLRLWPMSLWRERAQLLYQGAAFDQLMTTGGLDLCLLSWYCHDLFFSDINHYIINNSIAEGYVVWRWLNFKSLSALLATARLRKPPVYMSKKPTPVLALPVTMPTPDSNCGLLMHKAFQLFSGVFSGICLHTLWQEVPQLVYIIPFGHVSLWNPRPSKFFPPDYIWPHTYPFTNPHSLVYYTSYMWWLL